MAVKEAERKLTPKKAKALHELAHEKEKLQLYWKAVLKYIENDIGNIWTMDVKGDFRNIENEAGRIVRIFKRLLEHHQVDEKKYGRVVSDVKELVYRLNRVHAKDKWVKQIHDDLWKIIAEIDHLLGFRPREKRNYSTIFYIGKIRVMIIDHSNLPDEIKDIYFPILNSLIQSTIKISEELQNLKHIKIIMSDATTLSNKNVFEWFETEFIKKYYLSDNAALLGGPNAMGGAFGGIGWTLELNPPILIRPDNLLRGRTINLFPSVSPEEWEKLIEQIPKDEMDELRKKYKDDHGKYVIEHVKKSEYFQQLNRENYILPKIEKIKQEIQEPESREYFMSWILRILPHELTHYIHGDEHPEFCETENRQLNDITKEIRALNLPDYNHEKHVWGKSTAKQKAMKILLDFKYNITKFSYRLPGEGLADYGVRETKFSHDVLGEEAAVHFKAEPIEDQFDWKQEYDERKEGIDYLHDKFNFVLKYLPRIIYETPEESERNKWIQKLSEYYSKVIDCYVRFAYTVGLHMVHTISFLPVNVFRLTREQFFKLYEDTCRDKFGEQPLVSLRSRKGVIDIFDMQKKVWHIYKDVRKFKPSS